MGIGEALGILGAGLAAGTINAVVGSGTLITFPVLLAFGYAPVEANVSNTVGLVPGSISGAIGYRRELEGQGARIRSLGVGAVAGGLTGGLLLLALPGSVFRRVVPFLILLACVLVLLQPRLARRRRRVHKHGGPVLHAAIFGTAIYGGYFGAAQGVLFIALLGIFLEDGIQRLNGLKNALAALVNGVAAVLFMIFADVSWGAAGLLALGSSVGGQVGATLGRRIAAPVLRALIVVVGTVVAIRLLLRPA